MRRREEGNTGRSKPSSLRPRRGESQLRVEAEMEGLFSAQAVLRRREEEINKGFKEMQDEKEGLEAQLQVVLMNTDVLEAWVRENEGKSKTKLQSLISNFHTVDIIHLWF